MWNAGMFISPEYCTFLALGGFSLKETLLFSYLWIKDSTLGQQSTPWAFEQDQTKSWPLNNWADRRCHKKWQNKTFEAAVIFVTLHRETVFYLKSFIEKREVQNFLFLQRLLSNSTFCFQCGATPIGSIPHQCESAETGDEASPTK